MPPLDGGAVNVAVACVFPGVTPEIVGAPGTVAGVTVFDAADGALVPALFVAVTVQLTGVPFVRPVTTIGDPAPDALCEPHVAVYAVIAAPPFEPGAVKETVTCAFPATALAPVGAPGTVAGVTLIGAEAAPVPIAFVALTVHATGEPLTRPATTIGDVVPEPPCVPQVAV